MSKKYKHCVRTSGLHNISLRNIFSEMKNRKTDKTETENSASIIDVQVDSARDAIRIIR